MLAIVIAAAGALNMPCAELKNIELERATITSAVDVAAGLVKPPNAPATPQAPAGPRPLPRPAPRRPPPPADPAALPRHARAEADAGFEHQCRAVAAHRELERQVPRRR